VPGHVLHLAVVFISQPALQSVPVVFEIDICNADSREAEFPSPTRQQAFEFFPVNFVVVIQGHFSSNLRANLR
jgi:hypothetical protein